MPFNRQQFELRPSAPRRRLPLSPAAPFNEPGPGLIKSRRRGARQRAGRPGRAERARRGPAHIAVAGSRVPRSRPALMMAAGAGSREPGAFGGLPQSGRWSR
ncbi:hypothetical protein AAFF_G00332280 [Aldrovandia affinis]|uniref:Uncharacterized protein n=1 Tax=Aldrovandia affinis TaxID=143900 RepID=A0AAD7SNK3_9TELE|nr:hypothetical protein AAFF_G00332280 [Aldrovandia affinis]